MSANFKTPRATGTSGQFHVLNSSPECRLDGRDRHGQGTQSAVRFLLKKKEIPIRIGRARRTIKVKIYRVEKGATSPYRVEAWIEGTRVQHNTLEDAHVDVLDEFLAPLVTEHDLHPLEKPALWEPRSTSTFQSDLA